MDLSVNTKFLKDMQKNKKDLDIYLSNGVMLTGKIEDFDDISLLLDSECLVYYSNIISLKTHKN